MMSDSGDPVPAIREQDATGETAALFADLRTTLGVPVVNLVWRHIATIPGGLPWAWTRLRPLYAAGVIAAEAQTLRAELDLPELPSWPAEVLRAVGITAEDERDIRRVLAAYDRSNAMNLIALTALLMDLDGVAAEGAPPGPAAADGAIEGSLPTLLPLAAMAPGTAALVQRLNLIGERSEGRILASMYRHLAHWPAFLALAWTLIAPLDADGRLTMVIAGGLRQARTHAATLIGGLGSAPAELAPESRALLRAALEEFTTHPIGKMVTIGALLCRAMPEAEIDRRA